MKNLDYKILIKYKNLSHKLNLKIIILDKLYKNI